jgi:hypothetical protein
MSGLIEEGEAMNILLKAMTVAAMVGGVMPATADQGARC